MHSLLAVEDLNLRNMTASAKGTVENPGINVRQKSGLNRSLLEQSLGLILSQLRYKAEWAGSQAVAVNPRNTSRTCSRCNQVRKEPTKEYPVFRCPKCGLEMDRNVNAAVNILNRAMEAQQGGIAPAAPQRAMITAKKVTERSSCM